MKKLQVITHNLRNKVLGVSLALAAMMPAQAFAQLQDGAQQARPQGVGTNLMGIFQTIANLLLFVLGAVAVIMLIIGGFRFVVSGGDSGSVESARNTILYAIVGIVVAFLAYAAVNFVIERLQ